MKRCFVLGAACALASLGVVGCTSSGGRIPNGDYSGTLPQTTTAVNLTVGSTVEVNRIKAHFTGTGVISVAKLGDGGSAQLECHPRTVKAEELTCTISGTAYGKSYAAAGFPLLRL